MEMGWCQYNDKRSKKGLNTRWGDEIEKFDGNTWQRIAQNRQLWKELRKANVQLWTYEAGCTTTFQN